jgi:hypothetical protein
MSPLAKSSGLRTTSGVISNRRTIVSGITVNTDGTNAATVILYDNPSAAAGLVVEKIFVPGPQGGRSVVYFPRLNSETGLFISIAGVGAEAVAHYEN